MTEQAVREAFTVQADHCDKLGSPMTAHLCRLFTTHLDASTKVGSLCLNWQGDPCSGADNVPLRLCGGLHSLVLSGVNTELADAYSLSLSHITPELLTAVMRRNDECLHDFMASPPQTNEVARAAALWPCLMAIAGDSDLPLHLLEFGSSAGLNQNLDRFGYDLGGVLCGDLSSRLQLKPKWKGQRPQLADVKVSGRRGVDLSPFDLSDPQQRLRLRSYVWPDQPDRLARLDAAIAIADEHPTNVDRDDGLAWLDRKLADRPQNAKTVVFSTIAWQYMPSEMREAGDTMLRKHMRSVGGPVVWLRMEADGQEPGAALTVVDEADSELRLLGRADFHGRWIEWHG
ncbi:DUF2332 domain-containing protein [Ahrensia sp. R2A130]|uniref:DUF2332 domain-containing protein n=1 Tax=Ahrensia sp. R2A130 TaxID=744979 RepID=UPI0001E0C35F|nr:DUF2332 family protein [Ahrensia sp. R2A130]EFL88769.1 conserved hypothetical protein [Ahrensia sp. R2A130]